MSASDPIRRQTIGVLSGGKLGPAARSARVWPGTHAGSKFPTKKGQTAGAGNISLVAGVVEIGVGSFYRIEGRLVVAEGLGLVEFLADLRSDLQQAQTQARTQAESQTHAGGGDGVLWLGLEEVTVTVEVVHERTVSGESSGKVGGKFLVFASAEASVKAGGATKRVGTQTLTLTLKPRVDTTVTDGQGRAVTTSRGVDVGGRLATCE